MQISNRAWLDSMYRCPECGAAHSPVVFGPIVVVSFFSCSVLALLVAPSLAVGRPDARVGVLALSLSLSLDWLSCYCRMTL